MIPKVLALILAGGKGERLFPLTVDRSKPAVPIGGRYRIVDFVLSNLINSRIFSVYLLVQYKSQSLIEHIRKNWMFTSVAKDHFVALVPPQMRMGPDWFQGTADAVFQNINLIRQQNPAIVAIFGADHIYRMDIRQMIQFHIENDAIATIAARPVPIEVARSLGIISTEENGRIVGFQEKPKKPQPMPGDPDRVYASMGNYIFNADTLIDVLADAQRKKQHDFGGYVMPGLVKSKRLFAYNFESNLIPGIKSYEEVGYWRDVGTIPAYWQANMDMLGKQPLFELDNRDWLIHPASYEGPAAKFFDSEIINSFVAEGVVVHNAKIKNSIIRGGVLIEDDVEVEDSIIMDHVVLKKGSKFRNVIIDKLNVLEEGVKIGFDIEADRFKCHIDPSGIRILPRGKRYVSRMVK